jgi:hypothetical protein
VEKHWQSFLDTFASGPMSGGLYMALTFLVRIPMRLASNAIARLDTKLTGTTSGPIIVFFVGNFFVWLLTEFIPGLDKLTLYGAVSTAGAIGLFERHVVAPLVEKTDEAMDKSSAFGPKQDASFSKKDGG